ncbi:MAG: hypothetical protein ACLQVM_10980 [Terriglobia bacterium]
MQVFQRLASAAMLDYLKSDFNAGSIAADTRLRQAGLLGKVVLGGDRSGANAGSSAGLGADFSRGYA